MNFDVIAATQLADIVGVTVPWGRAFMKDYIQNKISMNYEFMTSVYMDVAKDNIPDEEIGFSQSLNIIVTPHGTHAQESFDLVLQEDTKVTEETVQKINEDTKALCDAFFYSYSNFIDTPEHVYLQSKMKEIKKDYPSPFKLLLK